MKIADPRKWGVLETTAAVVGFLLLGTIAAAIISGETTWLPNFVPELASLFVTVVVLEIVLNQQKRAATRRRIINRRRQRDLRRKKREKRLVELWSRKFFEPSYLSFGILQWVAHEEEWTQATMMRLEEAVRLSADLRRVAATYNNQLNVEAMGLMEATATTLDNLIYELRGHRPLHEIRSGEPHSMDRVMVVATLETLLEDIRRAHRHLQEPDSALLVSADRCIEELRQKWFGDTANDESSRTPNAPAVIMEREGQKKLGL